MLLKRHFIYAILLLFTFLNCRKSKVTQNRWSKVDSPFTGQQLRDIQFTSKDTGYILGLNLEISNNYNALLKTVDGGKSWHQKIFPVPEAGGAGLLFVYNSRKIFIAKNGIFESNDDGASWSAPDPNFNNTANLTRGLYFFDDQNGISINGGDIYKTVDGGRHFSSVLYDNAGTALRSLEVINNAIYVGGGTGTIFKSNDRGNTWIQFERNIPMYFSFVTENIGYALSNLNVYKTTNGGSTWSKMNSIPIGNSSGKILFVSGNEGFIINISGEIYHSGNEGKTWNLEHSEMLQLNGITKGGNNKIFIVGQNNLILSRELN